MSYLYEPMFQPPFPIGLSESMAIEGCVQLATRAETKFAHHQPHPWYPEEPFASLPLCAQLQPGKVKNQYKTSFGAKAAQMMLSASISSLPCRSRHMGRLCICVILCLLTSLSENNEHLPLIVSSEPRT